MVFETVKFVCMNGEVVYVPTELNNETSGEVFSGLIGNSDGEVQLPNIRSYILEKVVIFCIRLLNFGPPKIEKVLNNTDMNEIVEEWDADFIDIDKDELLELVLVAECFAIKPLLELACAKIATQIKNESTLEIRKYFQIDDNFASECTQF